MGLISLVLTLHFRTHFLSVYRRAKIARMIGLLASHTSELQENAPVIEVICFITEMLWMERMFSILEHTALVGVHLSVFRGMWQPL